MAIFTRPSKVVMQQQGILFIIDRDSTKHRITETHGLSFIKNTIHRLRHQYQLNFTQLKETSDRIATLEQAIYQHFEI